MVEIIKFLGEITISVAALAWLARESIKHFLDRDIESYKNKLQFEKEKNSITYREKIILYKDISQPIIDLVVAIEHKQCRDIAESRAMLREFDKQRLSLTAQLAMFAPQYVFDDYNNMIDYVYDALEGKIEYTFSKFREYAMICLSSMRKDIGIYADIITYNGHR